MPRAAGSSSRYRFGLLTPEDEDRESMLVLPSVTHILGVLKSYFSGATYYGYNMPIEELSKNMGSTVEDVKKYLYAQGVSPDQIMRVRMEEGNAAHRTLEHCAVIGSDSAIQVADTAYDKGVLAWWEERMPGWTVEAVEQPVWSFAYEDEHGKFHKTGYCGTLDLARRDQFGNLQIVDLKTRKKPNTKKEPARRDDLLQLAAYKLAWEEFIGTVGSTMVLVVCEDGKWYEDTRQLPGDAFLAVLNAYNQLKGVS